MKKKIVFIMMLIMAISGSYIYTTNAANDPESEAPSFSARPGNQVIKEGATFKIEAIVTGIPEPTVRWYKNNHTIYANDIYSMYYDKGRVTLVVSDAHIEDTAEYRIIAENSVGIAQVTCEIYVTTIP